LKPATASLRKLEAGGSDPTIGMLARLAKALGVPVTELLG
jgi:transcriptional regulator with XRE-family HTH domain